MLQTSRTAKTDKSKSKSSSLKNLYRIEFWRRNDDWTLKLPPVTLVMTRFIQADSENKALRLLKAKAHENARQLGRREDYDLVSMFVRDDISIVAKKTFDMRVVDREEKVQQDSETSLNSTCKECGDVLDDDYCQKCGWRRQTWLE